MQRLNTRTEALDLTFFGYAVYTRHQHEKTVVHLLTGIRGNLGVAKRHEWLWTVDRGL